MIRILCPEPGSFSTHGLQLAASQAELVAATMSQAEFEKAAPDFDAALIRFNTRVREDLLQRAPRLKAILSPTTGLDHIDMAAAQRRGVKIFHLRGQNRFLKTVSATAELTIALMLATMRKLPAAVQATKCGQWDPAPFRGREVAGKVLGLVGCGRLGSKVARTGVALGMRVRVYDPAVTRLPAGASAVASLQQLLAEADVLSLHVPLMPETVHMLGAAEFALMKPGCVLVNTARGAVVDTLALLDALQSGSISAAALDVVEDEELILRGEEHPLVRYAATHDNLLITPHIGGATYESVEKTDAFILNRYFKDQGLAS
jgi:D-3-phosphoglycerate dehydrogenase